jgi:hypothetical protein
LTDLDLIAVIRQDVRHVFSVAKPNDGKRKHVHLVGLSRLGAAGSLHQSVVVAVIWVPFFVRARVPAARRCTKHHVVVKSLFVSVVITLDTSPQVEEVSVRTQARTHGRRHEEMRVSMQASRHAGREARRQTRRRARTKR